MNAELLVEITEEGADPQRIAALSGYLREELLQLDVEDVKAPSGGPAPAGTRAVDVAAVGALLVDLGQSATGLQAVISAIRDWLGRGKQAGRGVRLKLGDDELELTQVSAADQDRLIQLFISHHPAARDPA
jgi:hypothetical protein